MTTTASGNALEAAILSYLAEHPHATDTLRGIAEWWIERERIRVEVTAVSGALSRLVQQGVLRREGTGEDALYCLVRDPAESSRETGGT